MTTRREAALRAQFGGFDHEPDVRLLRGGRDVMMLRHLRFVRPNGEVVDIEVGFISDGLSQPFLTWFLRVSPFTGRSRFGSFPHDWLYKVRRIGKRVITRKEADEVFYEAMRAEGTSWFVAQTKYWLVRWFSRWRLEPVTPNVKGVTHEKDRFVTSNRGGSLRSVSAIE